jgi:hypothetical protein
LGRDQSLYDQSKVLDRCDPYFRLERLNKDDQSWDVVWKSESIKDSLSPTWSEAKLPLQLLCNGDQNNPIKITIWSANREDDYMGFVESTISELVSMAKDGIPEFLVTKEKNRLFGFRGTKLKNVGLCKVLKAAVATVPSMLQYMGGGCSLDLMIGIDCSVANGDKRSAKSLHHSTGQWLNGYQAGIQKLGSIVEHFARGKHSSMWGFGAKKDGQLMDLQIMDDQLCTCKELLISYNKNIANNLMFEPGEYTRLTPLIEAAMFKTIQCCKIRQCYTILTVFTAGNIVDLQETVDLICTAAEDAPISVVIIGVGNCDFSAIEKLCGGETKSRLKDSRGIPIAREIVSFVSFKQFDGNASEVIFQALKDIPEQVVTYFVTNGIKPYPQVPSPDFDQIVMRRQQSDSLSRASRRSKGSKGSRASRDSLTPRKSRGSKSTS